MYIKTRILRKFKYLWVFQVRPAAFPVHVFQYAIRPAYAIASAFTLKIAPIKSVPVIDIAEVAPLAEALQNGT